MPAVKISSKVDEDAWRELKDLAQESRQVVHRGDLETPCVEQLGAERPNGQVQHDHHDHGQ